MITPLLVALIAAQEPVTIRTREPSPPVEQSQTFRARCGAATVDIRNYGLVRPAKAPSVTVDGAALRGSVAGVADFLAVPDAIYRFSVRCEAAAGTMEVQLYRTGRGAGGTPEYRVKSLKISRGTVTDARDEGPLEADAFYFK